MTASPSRRPWRWAGMFVATAAVAAMTACAAGSGAAAGGTTPGANDAATLSGATQVETAAVSTWSSYVKAENARAGQAGVVAQPTKLVAKGLDAYADRVSVLPGQPVGLYVRTPSKQTVAVTAYRIGYYANRGSRVIWKGKVTATPQPAITTLTAPLSDIGGVRNTHAVIAPWHMSGLVPTTGWPEGMYVLRLDGTSASRLVSLTVRSASTQGRLVIVDSPLTWQAYNVWGGRSLYGDEAKDLAHRSYAVTFDRPNVDGYGSGRFLIYVAPILREAERDGLPLAWVTDYDIANNPALISGAAGVVIGGHQEYWTATERAAVVAATHKGTNLAVFGANTAYWRVRLGGRSVALSANPSRRDGLPRVIFGAKTPSLDPLASSNPAGATARFRDKPAAQPESTLTGLWYNCYPAKGDWVVSDASWWGYAGTGLHAGSHIAGLIKPESDRLILTASTPRPMDVVAHSPLSCRGRASSHDAVYWSTPTGAGVFTAGTMWWAQQLQSGATKPIVTAITANVLRAFATPRAGRSHPVRDNVAKIHPPTSLSALSS